MFIAILLVFDASIVTYSQDVQLFLTKNKPGAIQTLFLTGRKVLLPVKLMK